MKNTTLMRDCEPSISVSIRSTVMGDGFADWMANLPEQLHTVPLNSLAIPGSHDSFTYFLDKEGPISPSEPQSLHDLEKVLGSYVKDVVYRWSVTQSYTTLQQLEAGIRYFDIRLSKRAGSDDLFIVHGLYGMKISAILTEINTFQLKHPKEIIILHFNHFYAMNPADHTACLSLIQETFQDKLCPFLGTESLSLDTMWENHLQVLAIYDNPVAEENMMFWPGSSITSPWPDVCDVTKLLEKLEVNYERGRPQDKFCVTQGILTPGIGFIMSHLEGSLKDILCVKAAEPLMDWLRKKQCGLQKGINICILDFVQLADFVPIIIGLNTKPQSQLS